MSGHHLSKVQNIHNISKGMEEIQLCHGACLWPDWPGTVRVHLQTNMFNQKCSFCQTNNVNCLMKLTHHYCQLCIKSRMLESCAPSSLDTNQVPLSTEHRDRLTPVPVILACHSSHYPTDSERKLSTTTTTWQEKNYIYMHTKNKNKLSRSLDHPCDQLFPASSKVVSVTVCLFTVEISDETNRHTLPRAFA